MVVFSTVPSETISGRQAMDEIDRALASLRREEERLTGELRTITDQVAKARADETGALGDLARFRLEDEGEAVGARLDQASKQAADLMVARRAAIEELEADQAIRSALLDEHQTKLSALRAELESVEDQIESLADEVDAKLKADDKHQQLVAAADRATAIAAAAAEKAEQSEADRTDKSKAYQDDALFMYLWNREFGTPQYSYGGLIRTLDRWVSNLVGFLEARPSYVLLNEIPERLRKHGDRVAGTAIEAGVAVVDSANQALAAFAGEDLAGRADALATGIDTQEEAIAPIEEELAALDDRAAAFAGGNDEMFTDAVAALSRSIAGDELRALLTQAERTPSPEDERFVERLTRARREIDRLEPQAADLRSEVAEVSRRRADLLKIARDFRRRGWEHRGHSFQFGDMMTGFMLGRISHGAFWGGLQNSHRGVAIGRGGFGGGFGGGGFRGGGGFGGGGGFRTGGGFGG